MVMGQVEVRKIVKRGKKTDELESVAAQAHKQITTTTTTTTTNHDFVNYALWKMGTDSRTRPHSFFSLYFSLPFIIIYLRC